MLPARHHPRIVRRGERKTSHQKDARSRWRGPVIRGKEGGWGANPKWRQGHWDPADEKSICFLSCFPCETGCLFVFCFCPLSNAECRAASPARHRACNSPAPRGSGSAASPFSYNNPPGLRERGSSLPTPAPGLPSPPRYLHWKGPEIPTIRHRLWAANKSSRPPRGRPDSPGCWRGKGVGEGRGSARQLPFPVQMIQVNTRRGWTPAAGKGGSMRERRLVPRERRRTKNKAKSPSRDTEYPGPLLLLQTNVVWSPENV